MTANFAFLCTASSKLSTTRSAPVSNTARSMSPGTSAIDAKVATPWTSGYDGVTG